MKIAVIAPSGIPSRRANTIQVMKMTQAFVETGHDVRLAAPAKRGQVNFTVANWQEISTHYGLTQEFQINWLPSIPAMRRYDYAWTGVRWARAWGAEVIYTRLPQAAAFGSLIGATTILEMHDFPHGIMPSFLLRAFLKGKGAYRLVLISRALEHDLQQTFRKFPGSPFTIVLADAVDLSRFAGLPEPGGARRMLKSRLEEFACRTNSIFPIERFTAGYTGHLYAGRGLSLILALAESLPEINFLIIGGESEDADQLAGKIRGGGLRNLTLTGFIPNAELPLFQAACDVLLMPYQRKVAASSGGDISRYLSPMKLFEYLACGKAICSSDIPVLREVLSEENAILLPPDDVKPWVEALKKLQLDPRLGIALGREARRTADRYTWTKRAMKILG
jgi:glycosyltransferase involved in cell wall biosynthesis